MRERERARERGEKRRAIEREIGRVERGTCRERERTKKNESEQIRSLINYFQNIRNPLITYKLYLHGTE